MYDTSYWVKNGDHDLVTYCKQVIVNCDTIQS
jgi:hypothetical protein